MTVQGKASTQKIFQIQNYKSIKHKQNGVEITHAFDCLHYSIRIAIFIYDNKNADTVSFFGVPITHCNSPALLSQ